MLFSLSSNNTFAYLLPLLWQSKFFSFVFTKKNNNVLKTLLGLKTAYVCFIMHDVNRELQHHMAPQQLT